MESTWIDENIEPALRQALGDLVLAAAHLEQATYDIAHIYRLQNPERLSCKRVLGLIQARVGDLGVPPWSDAKREKLILFCRVGVTLLERRDELIHAGLYFVSRDSAFLPVRFSMRDGKAIESETKQVNATVRTMLTVARAGRVLHHRLLYPSLNGEGRMLPDYVPMPGRTRGSGVQLPISWSHWIDTAAAFRPGLANPR